MGGVQRWIRVILASLDQGWADPVAGDEGDDLLFGGPGEDTLRGGPGADLLDGGSGTVNSLYGDEGDDRCSK
ncbi:MAG: hypothetical protein ACWGPS_08315 [Candidatus Promineifilaceae bacterium]